MEWLTEFVGGEYYGAFLGHPLDPRIEEDFDTGECCGCGCTFPLDCLDVEMFCEDCAEADDGDQ